MLARGRRARPRPPASSRASSTRIVVGTGPGELHRRSASGSRRRAGSRSRSTSRSPASRRCTRSPAAQPVIDARRGEVFSDGPGASRRPEELDVAGMRLVGDGAVRYRDALRGRAAPRCRPTTTPRTCPPRTCWSRTPARFGPADARRARSTSAPRTRSRADDRRRDRDPPARARRPRRHRGDRAARVPDAVVALDVRLRAREADVDLPRRVRGRPARRLHRSTRATSTPGT